jgi:hypothetical protein
MINTIPSREEFSVLWKVKSGGKAGVRFSWLSSTQFGKDGLSEQELYDALTQTWDKVMHEGTNHTNINVQEGRESWVMGVLHTLGMDWEEN